MNLQLYENYDISIGMVTDYVSCGAYPGVVRDQVEWLRRSSEHPRILKVPIVATLGESVLLLLQRDGRTPQLPEIAFVNGADPLVEDRGENLFPGGQYQRLQFLVQKEIRNAFMADINSYLRRHDMVNTRFMECWKAESEDLDANKSRLIGPASLPTTQTMIEIKKLPFHAKINTSVENISIHPVYQAVNNLYVDGNPIYLRNRLELKNKLEELIDKLQSARRNSDNLIDILQLLNALENMTPERELNATHT